MMVVRFMGYLVLDKKVMVMITYINIDSKFGVIKAVPKTWPGSLHAVATCGTMAGTVSLRER